jgi:hypothetical protein
MEIKNQYKAIAIFVVLAFLLQSCNKETPGYSVNLPVVESYLVPGNAVNVNIYQQKDPSDTAKYGLPATGLQVFVADGTQKVKLSEYKAGKYTYSDTTFVTTGKTYTLQFSYLNYAVSATSTVPSKPTQFTGDHTTIRLLSTNPAQRDTLCKFTWNSRPDSLNYILVFKDLDGTASPIPGGFGASSNRPSDFQINPKGASVYYITTRTFNYYGRYQAILLHVNQDYINLVNSNSSGSTSQNLLNASTNLQNGLGIFTAMQVDTLSLNVYY